MTERVDAASFGANMIMALREDDIHMGSFVESFADGHIIGLHCEGPMMYVALRMPGAEWSAQLAQAEARLDGLGADWRASVTLHRP
jgi:hypothetical protein